MKRCFLVIFGLIFLASCGCGGSSHVPVTGTLTLDGHLANGVTLTFFPEAGGTTASATTSPMGAFTVLTAGVEGCPPGKYIVTAMKLEQPSGSKPSAPPSGLMPVDTSAYKNSLPVKYANKETSGLSAVVERGMKPLEFSITTK